MWLDLFLSFFQVGLFSFGGGMAAIPLIQEQVVEVHGWLTLSEFTDLITISQMTPGPIAINAATFVGTRIAGFPGALVATVGNVTPSCIIISLLAYIYFKYNNLKVIQGILVGLRPCVVALIASAGVSIFIVAIFTDNVVSFDLNSIDVIAFSIFVISLFALYKYKFDPIAIIIGSGVLGGILYLFI